MVKVDVISGFLGAGKTTLIKKLLAGPLKGQNVVLIENEFGEIGIDGGFLKDAGIEIKEMNQGCICCTLVGDFGKALGEVVKQYSPDRIIIEPSGVGALSDVLIAIKSAEDVELEVNSATAVVDVTKCKMFLKNFAEFYSDQIETAGTIILSRTDLEKATQEKIDEALMIIKTLNNKATVVTTPLEQLDADKLFELIEKGSEYEIEIDLNEGLHHHHEHDEDCDCGCHDHEHHHHHHDHDEECDCHEHHHHHDHDEECHHEFGDEHCHEHHHGEEDHDHCEHHHHHDHDEECHEHHHHHHEHDEDCDCGCHDHEHHHHHEHDEHCGCGHDHEHHHHHHADEVFTSLGFETAHKFTKEKLEEILKSFDDTEKYGMVLRSKGMVAGEDGNWLHFDMVPEQFEVRNGSAEYTGKVVVIGADLKEEAIRELF